MLARSLHVLGPGDVPQVDVDVSSQLAVVVANHLRRFADRDVGDIAERHRAAVVGDNRRVSDLGERVDVLGRILNRQRHHGLVGLANADHVVAADREAHRGQRLVHGDAVLSHALEIEPGVHEVALRDPLGDHRRGAGHVAQQPLHVLRHLLDDREVLAFHLQTDRRLDARVLHHHARADRLRPAVGVADDRHRLVHLVDQARPWSCPAATRSAASA